MPEAKDKGTALNDGKRKVLGVVVRDIRRFKAADGGGFEGFAGGKPAKPLVGGRRGQGLLRVSHLTVAEKLRVLDLEGMRRFSQRR